MAKRWFNFLGKVLFFLAFFFSLVQPVWAAGGEGHFVLVTMDRVYWRDILTEKTPAWEKFLSRCAVGVMNTSTAGPYLPESGYLTIGSGTRLYATAEGGLALERDEISPEGWRGEELYGQRTGYQPGDAQILHARIGTIFQANKDLNYDFTLGLLGDAVHRLGLKTAVLGNSDNGMVLKRPAVLLVMDGKGRVDYGAIAGEVTVADPLRPGGRKIDYPALLEKFLEVKEKAHLIAIDLGDFSRLSDNAAFMVEEKVEAEKKRALREAGDFLFALMKKLDPERDVLVLAVPNAVERGNEKWEGNLTPVAVYGRGFSPGLLVSATTRRAGVIANYDITAMALKFFGVDIPPQVMGSPVEVVASPSPLAEVEKTVKTTFFAFSLRPYLVRGYQNFFVALFLLLAGAILLGKGKIAGGERIIRYLALTTISIPFLAFVEPVFPRLHLALTLLVLIFLAAGLAVVYRRGGEESEKFFFFFYTFFALLIIFDISTSSYLMRRSAFSYDPISGARYYGVGNEYMGILIGAAIMALALAFDNFRLPPFGRRGIAGLVALGVTVFLASPQLGANAGGVLAAVAGLGLFVLLTAEIKFTRRSLLVVMAGLGLLAAASLLFAAYFPAAQQSHIGRAMRAVTSDGWQVAYDIIVRKLAVNVKLIRNTQWSWVYFGNLILVGYLLYRSGRELRFRYPFLVRGVIAAICGSVAALIFNDSGIVAAGLLLPCAAVPLLMITCERRLLT